MGKQLANVIKSVHKGAKKHSPEILTGIGIAGMVTTVIFAVKATPKALELMDEERCKKAKVEETGQPEPLTSKEIIRATWKCYIPAAVIGSVSIFCLIGASSANLRRNAALVTAYTLSESALKEYQEKVIDTIGEGKEKAIRDAVAKTKVDQNPVSNREVIITGKGETLCYDVISGRYFKSDIDKIRKAENKLNRQMRDEMYVSLNDFFDELGLKGTKLGDDLGWHIDTGYIDLNFSSQLANDETPCLVINYQLAPRYEYRNH